MGLTWPLPPGSPLSRSGETEGQIPPKAGHLQGPTEGPRSSGMGVPAGCWGCLWPHTAPCLLLGAQRGRLAKWGLPGSGRGGRSPCWCAWAFGLPGPPVI